MLEDAREHEKEDEEIEDIMEQLETFETDDAFYVDTTPLQRSLHENWEDIIENAPEPDDLIADLYTLIYRAEIRDLLYYFGEMFVMSSSLAESEDTDEDTAGLPPRMLEYILGLISVADGSRMNKSETEPDDETEVIDSIIETARELMQAILLSNMSNPDSLSEEERYEKRLEMGMLNREIAAGRFVYPGQYFEAANRAYEPFEDVMESNLGFNISDAIYFTKKLTIEYGDKFEEGIQQLYRLDTATKTANGKVMNLMNSEPDFDIDDYVGSDDFKSDRSAISNEVEKYREKRRDTWIPHQDLVAMFPDRQTEFESYLDRMSVEIGSGENSEFKYPYQNNPVHSSPILKYDNEYIVPHFKLFFRSLTRTFYYNLLEYIDSGEFGDIWGEYLEEWTAELMTELSQNGTVLSNPEYDIDDGESESDVVVIRDGYCFVIECKAKKLTLDTRRGDYEPLENDVMKGIGAGYDQADRLITKIQNGDVTELRTEDGVYEINNDEIDEYIPVVVLGEQYDSVATVEYPRIAGIESNIPYVVSVYDLDVLRECISFDEFVEYLKIRLELTEEQKLHSMDELDYLGAYLDNGLEVVDMFGDTRVNSLDFSYIVSRELDDEFYPEFVKGGEVGR